MCHVGTTVWHNDAKALIRSWYRPRELCSLTGEKTAGQSPRPGMIGVRRKWPIYYYGMRYLGHTSSPPLLPPPRQRQVYVLGDVGIEEELDLIGVPHFGGPKVRIEHNVVWMFLCCRWYFFLWGKGAGGGVLLSARYRTVVPRFCRM